MSFLVLAAFACPVRAGAQAPTGDAKTKAFIALVEAARLGDVATVKRLLAEGADVNQGDETMFSEPALWHALDARQFDVAHALIEAGAEVKTWPAGGDYPLTWAAAAGDVESVRMMLARGADPKAHWVDRRPGYTGVGEYPINAALEWGRADVIKVLEKAGISWLGDDRGATALELVAKSRNVACADYLLSHGADANAQLDGNVPLDTAAARGDVAMMRLLLSRGADVNAVSTGESPINTWGDYRRTALVSAVINSELDAVRLLLKSGADARALDNLAIKWADMLGDYEAYDLLRAAGAPDPGTFPYRSWLQLRSRDGGESIAQSREQPGAAAKGANTVLPPSLLASVGPAPALERETKFAIINLGPGLDDAESLLAAKLSALPKAVVLERSELRAVQKERSLDKNFGDSPADNSRLGHLLGADALVILRSYPIERGLVVEARIVGVSTGLVAATVPFVMDGAGMDKWSTQLAAKCAAAGAWLSTAPKDARLVAVLPFTASVNTPEARALERQAAALLALRLAQTPGVFLVERATLDRLRAEGGADGRRLLDGSWLLGGSVDLSLNDGGASLHLTLTPGGGGVPGKVDASGKASAPVELAGAAFDQVAAILRARPNLVWTPADEAAAFLKQGEEFFARRMWREAEESADAAWALGLHDDRVARLLMESAGNRIQFAATYYTELKRKRYDLFGAQDLMSYRVPLLLPRDDDRDLGVEDYIAQANLILDRLEPVLDRTDAKIGGAPYASWVCGQAWDAATVALKVTEALSYQREYGEELDALRARLLALNARALEIAIKRKDAKTAHTLMALRCKNLPWWVHGDAAFQTEVLRVLHESDGWAPPFSEHAVWGSVFEIAESNTRMVAGRARKSWMRLAAVMAQSKDVRERYWGTAVQGIDFNSKAQVEKTVGALESDFPALVELDRSIPARVWAVGYKSGPEVNEGGPFECWYARVLEKAMDSVLVWGIDYRQWELASGLKCLNPEFRRFYLAQCERRLELIAQRGPSGYFLRDIDESDFNADELKNVAGLVLRAAARFDALAQNYPQVKDDIGGLTSVAFKCPKWLGNAASESTSVVASAPEQGLVLKAPRLLFPKQMAQLSPSDLKEYLRYGLRDDPIPFSSEGRRYFVDYSWMPNTPGVYGFDAQGNADVILLTAPGNLPGSGLLLLPAGDGVGEGIDMTADYFACSGLVSADGGPRATSVLIYDRAAKTWKALVPPLTCHLRFDVKIFAGKIYYTFVYNPTIAGVDYEGFSEYGGNPDTLLKKGDPLCGVMEYDPKTSHFNLLVSNRRTPAASPLDAPGKVYRSFRRVSADEFEIEGFPANVYNARTGVWRAATKDDKGKINASASVESYCEVNGLRWIPGYDRSGNLIFRNRRKWKLSVKLPVTFQDDGVDALLKPYPPLMESYAKAKKAGNYKFQATPYGWSVKVGPVYYWLPMAVAKDAIQKALAEQAAKATTPAPAAK